MSDPIEISFGPFSARLFTLGATLNRFQLNGRDLVLDVKHPQQQPETIIYAGAIIGPIANRVTNGHIQIGPKTHQMQRNENKTTTLHSGDDGLHARDWDLISHQADEVTFECRLPDGACGLPGNRRITAKYQLNSEGLQLDITATTDARTPINITHHPYWALDTDLTHTMLQVSAPRYLPVTDLGLPSGAIDAVAGTTFDFQKSKPIGPASTMDHNFCLARERRTAPQHAARLTASDGLTLSIQTTEPGLHVYTGSGLPDLPEHLTYATKSGANAAIALEPQGWPDAPSNDDFPSVFLDVGDVYRHVTIYQFS